MKNKPINIAIKELTITPTPITIFATYNANKPTNTPKALFLNILVLETCTDPSIDPNA